MTAGDNSTSTSIVNEALSFASNPSRPSGPNVNDSRGVPRYGGSKASFSVRLVAVLANNCSASRKLLLPAAFGPKSAESGLRLTSTFARDLYPLILTRLIIQHSFKSEVFLHSA